jgi:hypothetical protein
VLRGRATELPGLTTPLAEYVLAFYRLGEPGPKEGKVLAFEPEQEPEAELLEARRNQAGA